MRTIILRLAGLVGAVAPGLAAAHAGHGATFVSHWHATDTGGWALGLAIAAVALWLLRRK